MTETRSAASVEVEAVEDEFVGSGASRPDSLGWEEVELEAELRVGFDLSESARDDGGELGTVAGAEELEEREREPGEGAASGERGEEQVGVLVHQGATAWRQWPWSALWKRREKDFYKNPLPLFSIIARWSSS